MITVMIHLFNDECPIKCISNAEQRAKKERSHYYTDLMNYYCHFASSPRVLMSLV